MKRLPSFGTSLAALFLTASCCSLGCSDDDSTSFPPANPATGGQGGAGATGGAPNGGSTPQGGGGAGATGGTTPQGGTGGSGGSGPSLNRTTISGDATWTVSFDAAAEANGATDCSYTRHYEGVEDMSTPWLCPECEVVFVAAVTMTAGEQDCFSQVSPEYPPATEEWIGYANGLWYRGRGFIMADQGTATVDAGTATWTNQVLDLEAPVGGGMAFDVAGSFTLGSEQGNPLHGFNPPATYACGWPKADPPAYQGDYALAVGNVLPDGVFKDACDEPVRLHDFQGAYLVVDMSAMDCPPCQNWADQEEQFVQDMAGQGIDVHVITMLAPSLQDTLGETTTAMLDQWIANFSLASPVLADRAWGLSMFLPLMPPGDPASYPSWVLVAPDLEVLETGEGFGGTTFDDIAALIIADAG